MTPDEMEARLNAVGTAPGQSSYGGTVIATLQAVQALYNLVGGVGADVSAAKQELDAAKAELDKVAPGSGTDLTNVYARLDALSKHLGVGTA